MNQVLVQHFFRVSFIFFLFVVACGKENKPETPDTPDPKPESLKMTVNAHSPHQSSKVLTYLASDSKIETDFKSVWSSDTPMAEVYAKQGDNLIYISRVNSTELSADKTKAVFDITIPDKVDRSKPFIIYGLNCDAKQESGSIYYKSNLKRGRGFGMFFKTTGTSGTVELTETIAGTAEVLFLINKTDTPIQVKHRGFYAEKVWYFTSAEVAIDDNSIKNTEQGPEVESEIFEVPGSDGQNTVAIHSYYVPNGNKIADAQLIMEVNGQEVRSVNRLSSDLTLQTNHCYAIIATWDGEKLFFGDDSGDSSIIEIPSGAEMSNSDIQLLGDGDELNVTSDGHFGRDVTNLVALNQENVVYISYGAGEASRCLNSKETAVSLLLPLLPLTVTDMEESKLWLLKQMIGHLDQTKELAAAIDASIVRYGYTNMSFIEPQMHSAAQEIKRRLGLENFGNINQSSLRFSAPSFPYFTFSSSNQSHADGFYLTIKDSRLESENGKKYWRCTVDLLSGDRFCYTSLTKGYKDYNEDLYGRLDDSFSDTFKTLIKPMNVSSFMDFGTLSDLATDPKKWLSSLSDPDFDRVINQFWEPLKNLGHIIKGEETETVTFDKIKVSNIDVRFYGSNEHILIIGPGFDESLLLFNIVKICFQPVLKLLIGEIKKTDEYKNDKDIMDKLIIGFVEWMSKADLPFRAKLLATFTDKNLSWSERMEVIPMLSERFENFILDEAIKYLSKESYEYMFSLGKGRGYNDPEIKAIFAVYKAILVGGDILQLMVDINYKGIAFNVTSGMYETDGGLDDVTGSDL